jgi:hypothetical protein
MKKNVVDMGRAAGDKIELNDALSTPSSSIWLWIAGAILLSIGIFALVVIVDDREGAVVDMGFAAITIPSSPGRNEFQQSEGLN